MACSIWERYRQCRFDECSLQQLHSREAHIVLREACRQQLRLRGPDRPGAAAGGGTAKAKRLDPPGARSHKSRSGVPDPAGNTSGVTDDGAYPTGSRTDGEITTAGKI